MERENIRRHFESIGARVRFRALERDPWSRRAVAPGSFLIDIAMDRRGSIFDIALAPSAPELVLLQVRPKQRHLLLYSRDGQRFLCGHDERDWFVAAVPERVSTVRDAKLALMPRAVRKRVRGLPQSATDARRNRVFKRQGEWFFVSVDREFPDELVLRDEPLQRSPASEPHVCEELYRENGELVYVVSGRVYNESEYRKRKREDKWFGTWGVETRLRDPDVYVRGRIRHADHATVRLDGWHRVYLNAELTQHVSVAYLD